MRLRRAEGGIAAGARRSKFEEMYPPSIVNADNPLPSYEKPWYGDEPGILAKTLFGIGDLVTQANQAMPWGGNDPSAIGIDTQRGTIDPSVMVPFASNVAGYATTGAMAAPPVAGGAGMGIRAYHGSPHDFDRFSMDKIGTGEGAQAYGHGLYFAENPSVAGQYKDNLATYKLIRDYNDANPKNRPGQVAQWQASGMELERMDDALKVLEPESTQAMRDDWIRKGQSLHDEMASRGRMYEVDIDASPDEFLDWDKPLSEQPAKVREALGITPEVEQALAEHQRNPKPREAYGASLWYKMKLLDDNPNGSTIAGNARDKALQLHLAGIKGIRYKDAGSRATSGGELLGVERGADGWKAKVRVTNRSGVGIQAPADMVTTSKAFPTEEAARAWADEKIGGGTHNYVVFDDSTINILKKYGLAGLTAAGGAGAAMLGGSDPSSASQPEYTTGGKFAAGGRTPRMASGGIADAAQMRVTVQKGDNPSRIAKRILGPGASGTEVQALANAIVSANGIKNDRRIQIGGSLVIPGQAAPEVDMPAPRPRASGIAAQANAAYRPEEGKPTGRPANPRRDDMAKGLAGIGRPNQNDGGWTPYFQMTRGMNQREAIANEVDQRLRDANLMDNPSSGMKGRPFTTPYSGMPTIDSARVSPSMSVSVKENMDIGTKPNARIPETFSRATGLPDMNDAAFPRQYVPGLLPLQNVPTKGASPDRLSLDAMPGSIENVASRFSEPPKRSLPAGATTGEHFTDDRPLFMPGISSSLGHGLIKSPVPGRTDQLPLTVPKDSYIVPADVISGLGQGNTDAGWPLLKRILAARGANIDDGAPVKGEGVEIIAAGGEGVIHPEVVSVLGDGDVKKGHRLLDDIVLSVRKQTAKRLSSLPGPKR